MIRRLAALALAATLAACGFHPLYAPSGRNAALMQTVFVDIIPNRNGQILRQALQQRLEGDDSGVPKKYVLSVLLNQREDALSFNPDNSYSRVRDIATATWSLHAVNAPSKRLTFGTARAVDGHDFLAGQFFYADVQSQDATNRMANIVADQIAEAIATYFRDHPSQG